MQSKRTWENLSPETSEKWTSLNLGFYNAPSLHFVDRIRDPLGVQTSTLHLYNTTCDSKLSPASPLWSSGLCLKGGLLTGSSHIPMTRGVGTVSARHPDVTALPADYRPTKHSAALTSSLQHLDGERLPIQLRKLPGNELPLRQCLTSVLFSLKYLRPSKCGCGALKKCVYIYIYSYIYIWQCPQQPDPFLGKNRPPPPPPPNKNREQ